MMKKAFATFLVLLGGALPAAAQSQFQSTFELGIGYTRPATENADMVTLLMQAEDFFVETGIGIRSNAGVILSTPSGLQGGDTVVSWLVRGAVRPFVVGNTIGHVGVEFSLHSNSAIDSDGAIGTKVGLGIFLGVSHPLTDHLNFAVHMFPIAFEFGSKDTITKIGVAEMSAHVIF